MGGTRLVGLLLVVAYLELFRLLDWGNGIWRALLLVGLVGGAIVVLTRTPRFDRRGSVAILLLPAAALALAINVYAGVGAVVHTIESREIEMDQGQNTFRAVEYLRQGANPYARTAMLDPVSYVKLAGQLRKQPDCLAHPMAPEAGASLGRYWGQIDAQATSAFMPVVAETPACRDLARLSGSLGYKYGPALLAGYFPFILAFGKPGIFVAHIALVLIATLIFAWFGRAQGSSWTMIAGALLLCLAPSHLRHNVLKQSASDWGPTLAGVAALLFLIRGRQGWAAFFIGLSVACKILPGLLYLPLLLSCRRRTWALFLLPVVASFLPFLTADAAGFLNNIVLFNLDRPTDSTALAHFLWRPLLVVVQIAGLAAMTIALGRAHKQQWSAPSLLTYLWVAHAGALLGGAIFHNNYLIWLLPLLGLTFLFSAERGISTGITRTALIPR